MSSRIRCFDPSWPSELPFTVASSAPASLTLPCKPAPSHLLLAELLHPLLGPYAAMLPLSCIAVLAVGAVRLLVERSVSSSAWAASSKRRPRVMSTGSSRDSRRRARISRLWMNCSPTGISLTPSRSWMSWKRCVLLLSINLPTLCFASCHIT